MKVSLNIRFIEGPFGGAMQFARSLKLYLEERGETVTNDLMDNDIDIILHIAPFPFQEISAYSYIDAYRYKLGHPNAIIVLRINIVDEGKNTDYMNEMLCGAGKYSDHLVFIASWLKPILASHRLTERPSTIILNGADHHVFNHEGKRWWDKNRTMRIVTHHWSSNPMKGHDVYGKLDKLLSNQEFSNKFEFTFIGNIPRNSMYGNTKLIHPLSGNALADALKSNDIYVTAARNEAGGMHHIEGALCGLPILYIESGALPEYCHEFGVGFTEDNFQEKLDEIYARYEEFAEKIKTYPYTSDHMNMRYHDLFKDLIMKKSIPSSNKVSPALSSASLAIKNLALHAESLVIRTKDFLRSRFVKNTR